jgi:hypothetical protein
MPPMGMYVPGAIAVHVELEKWRNWNVRSQHQAPRRQVVKV